LLLFLWYVVQRFQQIEDNESMRGSEKTNQKLNNKIHPKGQLKQAVMKESNTTSKELCI